MSEELGLVAHWSLDETEGDIAYDSAGDREDTVHGNPTWQPDGGKVYGALAFDGIDDYISTPFVLNPENSPFSVFAWIKGGAPGQMIISQPAGATQPAAANWLMTDQEGRLLTELGMIARVGPLLSDVVITDGQWYRIGFVWDGMRRALYVDDILVAEDAQGKPGASTGGLYIGVGKDFTLGSFFSGMIDDVRIYNRAVSP
ncbi:MAG: LamG domain-containing protein [Planctomycetota bacterium]